MSLDVVFGGLYNKFIEGYLVRMEENGKWDIVGVISSERIRVCMPYLQRRSAF